MYLLSYSCLQRSLVNVLHGLKAMSSGRLRAEVHIFSLKLNVSDLLVVCPQLADTRQ